MRSLVTRNKKSILQPGVVEQAKEWKAIIDYGMWEVEIGAHSKRE